MKKIIVIVFIIFIIAISCKDDYYSSSDCSSPDYSNCNGTEPKYGQLTIDLTINSENPKVPISIYTGKVEDNVLYLNDTASSASYTATVDINHYYSVKAEYKSGTKTIIAIDGDDVKSKTNTYCDSTCWRVQNGSIDVRLKYN